MSTQNPKKDSAAAKRENLIVMIVAAVLATVLIVFATITFVNTFRKDNPSGDGTTAGPTNPTVDAAAEGQKRKDTIALTIGEHQLNAVEVNYYYTEVINKFVNDYYYYIAYMGLIDTTKPLNEQYYDEEKTTTWADYFLDLAEESIKSTYMLCDLAEAAGFTLPEEDRKVLDSIEESIEYYAQQNKYSDVDSYLVSFFGYGSDLASYLAYSERAMLADAYYTHYANSLEYTVDDLTAFEADKKHQYNSYTYASYYLSADKYLTGGVEDSDGKITYTDEQKAAAAEAAKVAAEALNGTNCDSLETFKSTILGMDVNASLDSVSVTENKDVLYGSVDSKYQEWLKSDERVFGDVAIFAKTTTSGSGENAVETVNGYYIVWFGGVNDNQFALKDVRHLLVMFKDKDGKTYSDGITSFTDEQKATAKAAAEKLLEQWKSGEATESAFIQLAIKNSEDTGSAANGGLYEDIYPGQMVENFEAWCYEEGRQFGDTGLVESPYGYHIMFFVGDSDITFRNFMLEYDLRSSDLNEWHNNLLESAQVTEVNLEYVDMDMKLSG